MKTINRQDAINDLCKREYDWLKREFGDTSKSTYVSLIPLVAAGIGGFDKMDSHKLENYYETIYDENVKIIG